MKKDPSMIEKEERDKLKKAWDNMLKNFGRHYKMFVNFHRKQVIDAKKFSESCQREVHYASAVSYNIISVQRNLVIFFHFCG